MAKRSLVSDFMAEVVVFGGLRLTRADVHRILTEDGFERRAIDLFAFATTAVAGEPIGYAEFRAIETGAARDDRGSGRMGKGSSRGGPS